MYGFFKGKRGLRQGDPLSPFLFGLSLEVFSRKPKMAIMSREFHYHPMCAGTSITHLAYADDLLLFAQADESTINLIAGCLRDFGMMVGLHPNLRKSHLIAAKVLECVVDRLLELIGFQWGSFPFCYLGIPIVAEKLRTRNYGPLTETIMKRLASWPKHTLSYVNKLELVRTVLQGIECFLLSILSIPCAVIEKIYAICWSFMWSTKHPPISWAAMCLAKEEGGYGLRDLRTWNSALLSRAL